MTYLWITYSVYITRHAGNVLPVTFGRLEVALSTLHEECEGKAKESASSCFDTDNTTTQYLLKHNGPFVKVEILTHEKIIAPPFWLLKPL